MNSSKFATENIGKLFFKLSVPAVIAQLINLLYNLVDRMYIGRMEDIGSLALTGVGVCAPLIMIISAFSYLIGVGGGPKISMYLGEGNMEKAKKTLGNSFVVLIFISVILTVFFLFFGETLLLMFGSSENTIEFATDYFNIYLLGTIFVQISLGLNSFITAQGFAKTSMATVVIGALINIVLDPILIYGFNMGVKGAALATVIAQAVTAVWVLVFLTSKKPIVRISRKYFKIEKIIIIPVLALGTSQFIITSTESLLVVAFNSSLYKYGGDLAVGSMTILSSVMQIMMLPLNGMAQGAGPIMSFNFGAKNYKRIKETYRLLMLWGSIFSVGFWIAILIVPEIFVKIFNSSDVEFITYTANVLKIYMFATLGMGNATACQQAITSLGKAKTCIILAITRKIVILIPMIYILPTIFTQSQDISVFVAEPIADVIAITLGYFACRYHMENARKAFLEETI